MLLTLLSSLKDNKLLSPPNHIKLYIFVVQKSKKGIFKTGRPKIKKASKINMFKGMLLFREKWKNTSLNSMSEHEVRVLFMEAKEIAVNKEIRCSVLVHVN